MFPVFFGAVVALTLWTPAPHATHRPASSPVPQRSQAPTVVDLYSLRARRRMATYLRLRLLEWRAQGLERAADVVEHRLCVDELVPRR